MKLTLNIFFFFVFFAFTVSSQSIFDEFNGFKLDNLLIPKSEIMSGGPPKDGIPSITNPKFKSVEESNWLNDEDLVVGVEINNIKKAYPLRILVWHELVNDKIEDAAFLVTYCPLCGSVLVFSRKINSSELSFGVSGLLYQSDVLFYDHQSESLWSQLMKKAVSGKKSGSELIILPFIMSKWKDWKINNPESLILSDDTGYFRDYNRNPYENYEKSNILYFPVNKKSNQLKQKEKLLIVEYNGISKAYPLNILNEK
ncbi:MAG: DUF3179 domain-containing protein, partial [Candidatus Dadabacteria bacterium]|nr:DUF3179 domain-containing protein [Candidatus Dadabacteria bacterium]NIQ14540.1 DUF3179 domain-containing protein [Candidatus Dadabacteria bacterium]